MNKADLIKKIAEDAEITKGRPLPRWRRSSTASRSLSEGSARHARRLRTFYASKRKARIGRNPQTGASIQIRRRSWTRSHGLGQTAGGAHRPVPKREVARLALSRVDLAARAGKQLVGAVSDSLP